jgi:hypothetical protein
MKADKALQILVYCDAGITIVSMAVNRALSEFLPAPLPRFLEQQAAATRAAGDLAVTTLWIAVDAATLLAWIGLLNRWRPARALYFWTWVTALFLIPIETAWVFPAVGYMLDSAATLVGGALLGVLYFSDAKAHFERATRNAPETGEAGA